MFEKEVEEYVRKIMQDVINWDGAKPEERFYNEIKLKQAYLAGAEFGYNKANEWHYVTDKLPPNPKESEDGKSILPLNYICAYSLNNGYDDYEIDDFMYLGNGVWNGENKNYPIYAWIDCAVEVPLPPRKGNE